jgi:hypothetical protein
MGEKDLSAYIFGEFGNIVNDFGSMLFLLVSKSFTIALVCFCKANANASPKLLLVVSSLL